MKPVFLYIGRGERSLQASMPSRDTRTSMCFGFEPPTPTTPLWCATRLRYAPTDLLPYPCYKGENGFIKSGPVLIQAGILHENRVQWYWKLGFFQRFYRFRISCSSSSSLIICLMTCLLWLTSSLASPPSSF